MASGSNNIMSISDDYYSAPSTSKSSITFNIYNINLDCSYTVTLSENDTVGELIKYSVHHFVHPIPI